MLSDKVLPVTFLISLTIHGVILFQNIDFSFFSSRQKEKRLEVSYIREPKKPVEYPQVKLDKKEPLLKLSSKIKTEKKFPPPFVNKENIFGKNSGNVLRESTFAKPAFIKTDIIAIRKKINLPPIDIEKINNPSYISYYQIVREKIRRAAYQNYTRTETGEVYLSFIISNDGYLKDVRLVGEKSSPSLYLREIALRSIRDASPFPNFPKELDYPQLSFNVIISFEVE